MMWSVVCSASLISSSVRAVLPWIAGQLVRSRYATENRLCAMNAVGVEGVLDENVCDERELYRDAIRVAMMARQYKIS